MNYNISLVSVVIPCFNVEDYIEECVMSVIGQTYKNLEIICIDNNSTDTTWQKLEELKKIHTKIIIDKEEGKGAPKARNSGLSLAKGDWIQFLDADDLLEKDKIKLQMNLIDKDTGAILVAGSYKKKNIKGDCQNVVVNKNEPLLNLLISGIGITSSNLFKSSTVRKIGGWDEAYKSSQEVKLMFEMLKLSNTIMFDESISTIIRERPKGQITQQNPKGKWKQFVDLRVEMIEYIKKHHNRLYVDNKSEIDLSLFNNIRHLAKYDLSSATELHHQCFAEKFVLNDLTGKTTRYSMLYSILGFRMTEIMYKLLSKRKE